MNLARAIGWALPPTIAWLVFRKKMSRRWSFRVGFLAIIMWLRPVNGLIVALLAIILGITDETTYWILQLVYFLPVGAIYFVIYFSKLPPKQEKCEDPNQAENENSTVQIENESPTNDSSLEMKTTEENDRLKRAITSSDKTTHEEMGKMRSDLSENKIARICVNLINSLFRIIRLVLPIAIVVNAIIQLYILTHRWHREPVWYYYVIIGFSVLSVVAFLIGSKIKSYKAFVCCIASICSLVSIIPILIQRYWENVNVTVRVTTSSYSSLVGKTDPLKFSLAIISTIILFANVLIQVMSTKNVITSMKKTIHSPVLENENNYRTLKSTTRGSQVTESEVKINYCAECGSKLATNAKFCSVCGAKVPSYEEITTDKENTSSIISPRTITNTNSNDPEIEFDTLISEIISRAEKKYFTPDCAPYIKPSIEEIKKGANSDAWSEVEKTIGAKAFAYKALYHIVFDVLCSGQLHIYRGVLNPMKPGDKLLYIVDECLSFFAEHNYMSEEEIKEQKKILQEGISMVG